MRLRIPAEQYRARRRPLPPAGRRRDIGSGLILREKDPLNLESPASALREWITRAEDFYVRNHFAEPDVDPSTWRLKIAGAVTKPTELSYRDLTAMPSQSQVTVLECAGSNGRGFLAPKEQGTQWQSGAAGNAEYTGVPLQAPSWARSTGIPSKHSLLEKYEDARRQVGDHAIILSMWYDTLEFCYRTAFRLRFPMSLRA